MAIVGGASIAVIVCFTVTLAFALLGHSNMHSLSLLYGDSGCENAQDYQMFESVADLYDVTGVRLRCLSLSISLSRSLCVRLFVCSFESTPIDNCATAFSQLPYFSIANDLGGLSISVITLLHYTPTADSSPD